MRKHIAVLFTCMLIAFGFSAPVGADTQNFGGTLSPYTTATHNFNATPGLVTASTTCSGSGVLLVRINNPDGSQLNQNAAYCPGPIVASGQTIQSGAHQVYVWELSGYTVTYSGNVTFTNSSATTTTTTSTTTTTAPTGTCPAPTNFRLTGHTATTVSVAWNAVSNASSYDVYFAVSPDPPSTPYATGLTTTSTTLSGLNSNTTYNFAVRAKCNTTLSGNSNVITVKPGTGEVTTSTTTTSTTTVATTTTTTSPPAANVCNIAPANGEAAITAAINSCPNGTASAFTVVKFPANANYTINRRVEVKDRQYLNIDLNGSKITTTSNGTVTKSVDPVIIVLRGNNIQIRNGTLTGDFTAYEGQPRSLSTIGTNDPEFTEAQMGVGLYGTDSATLENLKLFNLWGDGVTIGPAHYADPNHVGNHTYTHNVWMKRLEVETVGRMCFGPTSGNNIWIEDSQCRDAWYGGIDAEADNVDQPLRGHHYLRNTFDGFNHFGILIPVITTNSGDYEIRDNTFLTPSDQPSYTVIELGIYSGITNRATNVNITGNKVKFYCQAIAIDNVDGGAITGNTLTRAYKPLPDGSGTYTPEGLCGIGNTDPIQVTDSTNVSVSNNTIN